MSVDTGNLGKQFVFVVTLLGIFFMFVMTMPPELYYTSPDYGETEIPETWSPEDIKRLLFSDDDYSNVSTAFYLDIERTGLETINLEGYWQRLSGDYDQWIIRRYWYLWGFWKQTDDVLPKFPKNTRSEPKWLSETDIFHDDNLDESGNFSRIDMVDSAFNYVCFIAFNETEYGSLAEAIDDGHVLIEMAMGFEYESGVLSGWDLITRLLTFQLPDISVELNYVIALPIWALICFLVFVTITMIVEMLPFT